MKKSILGYIALLITAVLILCLTGCGFDEEVERERQLIAQLPQLKLDAEAYLEKKYDTDFTVSAAEYYYNYGLFSSTNTGDASITFEDNTEVYYDCEKKCFYDNLQSQQIKKDFSEKMLPELMSSIIGKSKAKYYLGGTLKIGYKDRSVGGSWFHEYYNGDIANFINETKPRVDMEISFVCGQNEWKNILECADELFSDCFDENNSYMVFYALTEDGYSKHSRFITDDGVFAITKIVCGDHLQQVQNYIEAADGMYVCIKDDHGFALENGDITSESCGIKNGADIFKLVFSPRLKTYKSGNTATFYVKLDEAVYGEYDKNAGDITSMTLNIYSGDTNSSNIVCTRRPTVVQLNEYNLYWIGNIEKRKSSSDSKIHVIS